MVCGMLMFSAHICVLRRLIGFGGSRCDRTRSLRGFWNVSRAVSLFWVNCFDVNVCWNRWCYTYVRHASWVRMYTFHQHGKALGLNWCVDIVGKVCLFVLTTLENCRRDLWVVKFELKCSTSKLAWRIAPVNLCDTMSLRLEIETFAEHLIPITWYQTCP